MFRWLAMCGLICVGHAFSLCAPAAAQTPTGEQLPDTQPLTLDEPLDVVMVRGINRFAERELAASRERRAAKWNRDYSSEAAYLKSIEPHRQRLREMIGAVDPLVEPNAAIPLPDLETDGAIEGFLSGEVIQWDVVEGVTVEGRVITPSSLSPEGRISPIAARAAVVLIPDSTQTPESQCGLDKSLRPEHQLARRLADSGCLVLVLTPINRSDEFSGHPDIRYTNLPHRELIYRCGFELGRHPLGYEVQAAIQAKSMLRRFITFWHEWDSKIDDTNPPWGIAGVGDGGATALYAAALDPEFTSCYVAAYFDERESVWKQPIDRNVFGLLTEFGDADIASLIAPRWLAIDNSYPLEAVTGPPSPREGRLPYAAPGTTAPPTHASALTEYLRARRHHEQLGAADRIEFVSTDAPPAKFNDAGIKSFLKGLGINQLGEIGPWEKYAADHSALNVSRQKRLVESLVRHTQMLLHRSDKVRDKFWKEADRSSIEKWEETSQKYRDHVHDHMIGRLPLPTAPLNPRTRKVIDEPTHVGYEVVLDVYRSRDEGLGSRDSDGATPFLDPGPSSLDQSVLAGGILLLPKDLQPGEKRPVVVCQHGLEGTPMDTITTDRSQRAWGPYRGFSTQLVQRGFIVYAPQNPYKGEDAFRVIQRKSNPLGRSLFSYIIEQHRQTLTWLATLPYVDADRIAFYGLSYGGKTAVRVPPLLVSPVSSVQSPVNAAAESTLDTQHSTLNHPAYCLSICSADFNEWIRKNASSEDRYSYVYTKEYEMYEWNMGHVAGYAELSTLMTPRPFMVERGHGDGVAPDEWVGWEFAKVRRHYDLLGLGDRAEIEWFNGPHAINGVGTFSFLHRHLNWPERP